MSSTIPFITAASLPPGFGWKQAVEAIARGHDRPRAKIADQFLNRETDAFVNRAAWIDGFGIGAKSFTVFPGNAKHKRLSVQGAMLVFDDQTGAPLAVIDSGLVTYWKTAPDSVYGALLLARPDSKALLIAGTGVVADSLIDAYSTLFPDLERVMIWGRNIEKSRALASRHVGRPFVVEPAIDLKSAAHEADIISTATMSRQPILMGDWVKPGTHVDLIGAFKSDMREADDTLLRRSKIFVDSYETTLDHIGELLIPLRDGTITRADLRGDLYDLTQRRAGRDDPDTITLFKNGGGAHLDLMMARALFDWCE
ncbi:ornithine cyclodeaminase family protein [Roseovarius rhodophyticola]|uniref:Ornithine cyclodeaminase n=1 Tax=Roseovarius rhodophyticola TaxID=3080827 RepID=A0ABZ2TKE9_9RHOB|nr:ornithine cyclodeaminase [Roseovarius sp. W115]MDV2927960.1 ornithine cyclodeaminase [Roseovarius sp. W115]